MTGGCHRVAAPMQHQARRAAHDVPKQQFFAILTRDVLAGQCSAFQVLAALRVRASPIKRASYLRGKARRLNCLASRTKGCIEACNILDAGSHIGTVSEIYWLETIRKDANITGSDRIRGRTNHELEQCVSLENDERYDGFF